MMLKRQLFPGQMSTLTTIGFEGSLGRWFSEEERQIALLTGDVAGTQNDARAPGPVVPVLLADATPVLLSTVMGSSAFLVGRVGLPARNALAF
jgi:hypothetical protein